MLASPARNPLPTTFALQLPIYLLRRKVHVFSRFPDESQAASYGRHEPVCAHGQPGSSGPSRSSNPRQANSNGIAHQTCHRDHRREPQLRHVFATYQPKNGETVSNLLSKGIVRPDGSPGPNYSLSAQYSAVDDTTFSISPGGKSLYTNIPPVVAGGPTTPYFPTLASAALKNRICSRHLTITT